MWLPTLVSDVVFKTSHALFSPATNARFCSSWCYFTGKDAERQFEHDRVAPPQLEKQQIPDLLKVILFVHSEFTLIKFCTELCTEIVKKT